MGIAYEIEKVTDLAEITKFGVWMTPALAVDGDVKFAGEVPDIEKLKRVLAE